MSVRMQIYLSDQLYAALKQRARKTKKAMSEQIRESLRVYLASEQTDDPTDPIWLIAGMGSSGLGDLSERHDDYLYGQRKGGD